MRLFQRIVVVMLLMALTATAAACDKAAWRLSDESLGALAREVADRAAAEDVGYFTALTPDREVVPAIIEQVRQSGIASNYSDHLIISGADSGTLAYGMLGDDTPGASFAVRISLVDGKARVDQIITEPQGESAPASAATTTPVVAVEEAPLELGDVAVSVWFTSERMRGYGLQSALIGYTNTSSEVTRVVAPLDVMLRIEDSQHRLVSEVSGSSDFVEPIQSLFLAPGATVYAGVRFAAPEPGSYSARGRANGVWSPPARFEAVY